MFDVQSLQAIEDERWVDGPAGIEARFRVLRADHPKWQAFLEENGLADNTEGFTGILLREGLKHVVKFAMGEKAKKGKRQKKKLTKKQIERKIDSFDSAAVLSQVLDDPSFDVTQFLGRDKGIDPRPYIFGVASILLTDWEDVTWGNEEAPCDLHHKLLLLGFEGKHDGKTYDGPLRDESGRMFVFGGEPVGDALTRFFLDAAAKNATEAQLGEEESTELLDATPAGGSETSEG